MISSSCLNEFDLPVENARSVCKRLNSFKSAYENTNQLEFFDKLHILKNNRQIEDIELNVENVVCTTYFTSKPDPQGKGNIKLDSIEYIAPWYNSMRSLQLFGIVFHDGLSSAFVDKYQTNNIIFLECKLGDYSLNDERFLLYYMFFLKHKVKNILLTDGNDVFINKAPFDFFETKSESTIFVGRGSENKLIHSNWNLASITKLKKGLGIEVPNNFYEMAIYNAGIIGGNYFAVLYFLRQMSFLFLKIDNNKNNNMPALHYVLYYYYFPNCRKPVSAWLYNFTSKSLKKSINRKFENSKLSFLNRNQINYKNDKIAVSNHIFSGFPLNSKFNFFETNSQAYLIHK